MASNLFQSLGGGRSPMQNHFMQFMGQMKGQDPDAIINELVSSGKLSQAQLNQVQQRAQQMKNDLASFRGMFGF